MANLAEVMDVMERQKSLEAILMKKMGEFEAQLKAAAPTTCAAASTTCAAAPAISVTITQLQDKFNDFKSQMCSILHLLRQQIAVLSRSIDDIEMRHRRKYLNFSGISEDTTDSTLSDFVSNIIRDKLGLSDFTLDNIVACHRLGKSNNQRCRPVLVRFSERSFKAAVWKKKTALKGTPFSVAEFLTRQRQSEFASARKRFGMRRCWTANGDIIVKLSDRSRRRLFTEDDLAGIAAAEDEGARAAEGEDAQATESRKLSSPAGSPNQRVVFDQNTEEIQNAFKFGIVQITNLNRTRIDTQLYVDIINTADAFKLSRLICNQFGRGVIAMLGAVTPDSFDTLHSYTNTFQMPFVTPWFPEKVIKPSSGLIDYAISMRPDYHRAVIDTITFYGWKNVIYIYDSHDGLLRLQQLYQSLQPGNATFRISNVKRVSNATDVVRFLSAIERLDRWSSKYVVLDSTTQLAKEALILHVRDVQLGRRNYHYFLSGLVMDDRWEKEVTEFGAINITGFRVLDFSRKFVRDFIGVWKKDSVSAQAALMYDAVLVLVDAVARLLRKKPDILRAPTRRNANANTSRIIDCNPKGKISPFEHGDKISRLIKKTEIDGLTGTIRFNEEGHRKNFTLQVMELTVDGDMVKIGTWYDNKGLIPTAAKVSPLKLTEFYNRNKTYIVTTIEEPPYIMRHHPDPALETNDPYKGFCADLAEMISEKLEIKYELRLVKDGKYGNENPKIVGGWDGMIGELLRKEADIVIAPLTVTLERETVVDFSKPFLSFDMKPSNGSAGLLSIFTFLMPLSREIWFCLFCSLVAVTVVLFLVSRFSPNEWRVVSFTDTQSSDHSEVATTKTTIVNEFSLWNSLWFVIGSFMQQGSEITPRSLSGRIVGAVWWFFTFVVISFYTANLASYLTLSRLAEPSQSYDKIATCPEDTSSAQRGIAIRQDVPADEHGWLAFLMDRSATSSPEVEINQPCQMLVTVSSTGVKDFAIALPKGSKLRDGVNLALQSLKNEGEIHKLIRKWFTKTECHINEQPVKGTELSLSQVAGLFYVLMAGLAFGLGVALLEFCQHGRREAQRANVPLGAALKAKARLASRPERKTPPQRTPQRDNERLGWNGGTAYSYYSPANQIGQEETALHASFTQV